MRSIYDEKVPRASRSKVTGEQTIPMGLFKAKCTAIVQEVSKTGEPVTITKRGRPVVRIMPAVVRAGNTFVGAARDSVVFPHGLDAVEESVTHEDWLTVPAYEEEANLKFAPPKEPLHLASGDKVGPRGGRRGPAVIKGTRNGTRESMRKGIRVGR